ncbi:MAG: undecaprenyldiphospho-muramoylpentapeptide beta-N-acetylglucosaminyltransferase [Smithellaceae bacterium]|nr:undecaprenyldiphospho-muramoylpentapeptide beta-N-acetylglucosaminyltransferase [Smithellaceae bacterium]
MSQVGHYRVIIAGGGTGGHLFPGIAVAEEWLHRNAENKILFIGTSRGIEGGLLGKLGFDLRTIRVEGIVGRGMRMFIRNLFLIPLGMVQSLRIIRSFRPDLVLGVGGYASGPALLVAWLLGIKTAIAEQNAQPGITNRILGAFVRRIYVTYQETLRWFPPGKTIITGNPVRKAFITGEEAKGKKFTLLIFGGSQGSRAINEAMIDALPYLKNAGLDLRIIHQTGKGDHEEAKNAYARHGLDALVLPFITDMAPIMRGADIIVCRSGATSIAEITALGKASILIPFPRATHDHQTKNALALTGRGAAEMLPESLLNGRTLAGTLTRFYNNPADLSRMAENSAALGNPEAAARIVDDLTKMIGARG